MPQTSQVITLLQGDKTDDKTDFVDALPVNVSGVIKQMLNSSGYMLQQPGLTQYGTGSGIDRGAIWNSNQQTLFRVSGTDLISVSAGGAVTVLGTIQGSGQMAMPYSFNTQAIVGDGYYYLYDAVNGLRQITDANLGSPIDAVWVDGYYFFTDGEYIYHTDLGDESAIDPLKFATSEFSPDPTLGVSLTSDDKVMVSNRYTIEYFVNDASDNFAFTRIDSRAVVAGIVSTHAKFQINGVWYILGGATESDVSVFSVGVGVVYPLGARAVNKIIGQYNENELASAVLEGRTIDDYPYLIVNLPNDVLMLNIKLAESVGAQYAWSILKSDVAGNMPWRGINAIMDPRTSKWVCGDKFSGILGYLDMLVGTHYGALAECILHTPFISLEAASIDELEIITIPGYNVNDDATVFISMTYNGVFWGMEGTMQYGSPGAYNQRFIARALGDVADYFAIRFRWASTSRMAFATAKILYG